MKKVICVLIALILCLAACENEAVETENLKPKTDFSYGMWLSYSEIDTLLKEPENFKSEFAEIISNAVNLGITELYIHIRSHGDSLFESEYFPLKESAKPYDYDVFEYMLKECQKAKIRVFAWINPYRISAVSEDTNKLDGESPAKKWLSDGDKQNDLNVIKYDGIYLNPAEFEARQIVVNGVREVLEKYKVDGIHFDDYFYPTTDIEFDSESYEKYLKTAKNPLKLDDWRRANVDTLISDCKTAVELSGKEAIFSVSPAADIERNYNSFYADVSGWIEKGLVDEIIPQLYFGFNHTDSAFNFENLLSRWVRACEKNEKVKLKIGLAAYKIGTTSSTDGDEWAKNSDILSRQAKICLQNDRVGGAVFFSYSGLFSEKPQNKTERENLKKLTAK